MIYLLDVSALLAWLWRDHVHNERVESWAEYQKLAVCPISELGFLRISTQPIIGASMKEARSMLSSWLKSLNPTFIPCDEQALSGKIASESSKTTDIYLGNLAARHGLRLATLDEQMDHPAAYVIPHLAK